MTDTWIIRAKGVGLMKKIPPCDLAGGNRSSRCAEKSEAAQTLVNAIFASVV